jgi:hypothetical protein
MTGQKTSSVDPTPLTRVRQALQPDWVHTVAARRTAAGALVALAAVAAVRAEPDGDRRMTVVAAHDLTPGVALGEADIRVENRLAATLPDGAQPDVNAVLGATPAGPVRRGEVLTDVRVLGPRLADSAAGPNARIVPLRLVDNAVLDVIKTGDVVDVLAAPASDSEAAPKVVATDAVVVLVSAKPKGAGAAGDRVVLVALPAASANTVAGAALGQAVTVTLH